MASIPSNYLQRYRRQIRLTLSTLIPNSLPRLTLAVVQRRVGHGATACIWDGCIKSVDRRLSRLAILGLLCFLFTLT